MYEDEIEQKTHVDYMQLSKLVDEFTRIMKDYYVLSSNMKRLEEEIKKVKPNKQELDKLIKEKDALQTLLWQKPPKSTGIRTIGKRDLEKALMGFYNYRAVEIEKICVGSPDTATYVYPQKADPRLLLKVDIQYEEKDESH